MRSTEAAWSPADGEVLSVSHLLEAARRGMETLFSDVWVEGEISDLRRPSSGHAYFTISDERCRLKAVCFRTALNLMEARLADGAAMLFRGRMTVYEPRGDLQLVVEYAEPKGDGLLRLKLEALKKKLAAEGLFSEERKKPIPAMPRAVALVTSPTGAAVADMINVLGRRAPWVDVYVCPARVQGDGAARELVQALKLASSRKEVDTVIIGRGGGSGEDLSAFNDEALVRAVAAFEKPVISAVGHETDVTLVDFAADRRAPTPSAAAELAVREAATLAEKLDNAGSSLFAMTERAIFRNLSRLKSVNLERFDPLRRIEARKIAVDRAVESGMASLDAVALKAASRLAALDAAINRYEPGSMVAAFEARRVSLEESLAAKTESLAGLYAGRLALADGGLKNLDPMNVLRRGFAVVRSQKGRIVRDASTVAPGEEVSVTLARGSLLAEVKEVL